MPHPTRCAFLTIADLSGHTSDDPELVENMRKLGWDVEQIPWDRDGVDWSRFAAVFVRSTWDYQQRVTQFDSTLAAIAEATDLANPVELVRWNLNKNYLRELQERGVPVIPSVWLADGERIPEAILREWEAEQLLVKPVIGASASGIVRFAPGTDIPDSPRPAIEGPTRIVQPFLPEIQSTGELSLLFFAGEFSHAARKIPASGDFRVQEEHGGHLCSQEVADSLLELGRRCLATLPLPPLYARIDLVESERFGPRVMEVELIEPDLYLRTKKGAAQRAAQAFSDWALSPKA